MCLVVALFLGVFGPIWRFRMPSSEVSSLDRKRPAAAPKGLAAGGRKLWREVAKTYTLRPDEVAILEQACRAADLVDVMSAELASSELMIPGSTGQMVLNPIVAELRLQRQSLDRLLSGLDLPDMDGSGKAVARDRNGRFSTSDQSRQAALKRWGKR